METVKAPLQLPRSGFSSTISSTPPNQKYASGILYANMTTIYALLMAYLVSYVRPSFIVPISAAKGLRILTISSRLTWV